MNTPYNVSLKAAILLAWACCVDSDVFNNVEDADSHHEGVCQTLKKDAVDRHEFRYFDKTGDCHRIGSAGPCGNGKIFVRLDIDNGTCITPDTTCVNRSSSNGSANDTSQFPPPAVRFFNETGKCEIVRDDFVCGTSQTFFIIDDTYGECDCNQIGLLGRLVYWQPDDACYYARTQGPCPSGDWLIIDPNGQVICDKRPCLANQVYWPDGKCYNATSSWASFKPVTAQENVTASSNASGPCPPGSSLMADYGGYCKQNQVGNWHFITQTRELPCQPGYRRAQHAVCLEVSNIGQTANELSGVGLCLTPLSWNEEQKRCELD